MAEGLVAYMKAIMEGEEILRSLGGGKEIFPLVIKPSLWSGECFVE